MTGSASPRGPGPDTPTRVQRGLDEAALGETARTVAGQLVPPLVLYLEGDLGAGKTTFVRAMLRALGHTGPVKSPTYGLMEGYDLAGLPASNGASAGGESALHVLHLDLYRIADPAEVDFLGLGDLIDSRTVLCVEWPRLGEGALPPPDVSLVLRESGEPRAPTRDLHWYAYSDSGIKLCEVIDAKL